MAKGKRFDEDTETALAAVKEEQDIERIRQRQQEERETLIAQAHEIIGRVQANTLMTKFANVSSLVHLKNIKDSKIYRDLPMVGTWDKYCEYIGLSRQKVDEDLANLAAFGEDFLLTCQQFSLGYRDLRKLRQLTHDGTVQVTEDAIEISGQRIPLDADHKEDLQSAIEWVIEQQSQTVVELEAQKKAHARVQEETHKSMVKLQKDLDKLTREAKAKDLTPEEDAVIQQIENLQTSFLGYLLQVRSLVEADDIPGTRAKAALVAFLNQARMELNAYYDTAYDRHAAPGMAPEEEWIPPFERQQEP